MKRAVALSVAALMLTAAMAGGALAAPKDGMVLECTNVDLTLMRANGSSWWGLDEAGQPDGSVYVTKYIRVEQDGETVYEKNHGNKTGLGEPITCLAEHFDFDWTVDVVRTA